MKEPDLPKNELMQRYQFEDWLERHYPYLYDLFEIKCDGDTTQFLYEIDYPNPDIGDWYYRIRDFIEENKHMHPWWVL